MARLGKSEVLKSGVYLSKRSGKLITIERPWLEQFYDTKKKELIQLNTAIVGTETQAPIYRAIVGDDSIKDLEYIGKL